MIRFLKELAGLEAAKQRDVQYVYHLNKKLEHFLTLNLNDTARKKTGLLHPDILSRAAAFLLLKDSRASFEIEREILLKDRVERWGKTIAQAGLLLFL